MAFCPVCRSEYRPDITRCAHCEVELVAVLPEADESKADRLREALGTDGVAPIARANYSEACQIVEQLHASGVNAVVSGDPSSCGKGGHCSHFFVVVLKEDVQAAGAALREEWKKLVDAEDDFAGADPDAHVDLDAEGPHSCPACGASFEGTPEECPDCGLFLGAA